MGIRTRRDTVDGKLDLLRDEIHGRGCVRFLGVVSAPALGGIKPRLTDAEKRIKHLEGVVEQLAALHGKTVEDFEPTTSEYGRVLVDVTDAGDGENKDV